MLNFILQQLNNLNFERKPSKVCNTFDHHQTMMNAEHNNKQNLKKILRFKTKLYVKKAT